MSCVRLSDLAQITVVGDQDAMNAQAAQQFAPLTIIGGGSGWTRSTSSSTPWTHVGGGSAARGLGQVDSSGTQKDEAVNAQLAREAIVDVVLLPLLLGSAAGFVAAKLLSRCRPAS